MSGYGVQWAGCDQNTEGRAWTGAGMGKKGETVS